MVKYIIYSIKHNSELSKSEITVETLPERIDGNAAFELLKTAKKKYPRQIRGKLFLLVIRNLVFYIAWDTRDKKRSKIYFIEVEENNGQGT